MSSSGRQGSPGPAPNRGTSSKVKITYISTAGVVLAAVITGLSLYLSQGNNKSQPTTSANNSRVVVNVAPATAPPTTPSFRPYQGQVYDLPVGQCANVYSEPYVVSQDMIGTACPGANVSIYCTAETVEVGDSSVWDLIYFKTSWGSVGYIPDYYVYTGTNNAVEPSCST